MKAACSYDCGRNYTLVVSRLSEASSFDSKITPDAYHDRKTSTEVTYGALNNKIEWRCIEPINLTEISVELDSSVPCGQRLTTDTVIRSCGIFCSHDAAQAFSICTYIVCGIVT